MTVVSEPWPLSAAGESAPVEAIAIQWARSDLDYLRFELAEASAKDAPRAARRVKVAEFILATLESRNIRAA